MGGGDGGDGGGDGGEDGGGEDVYTNDNVNNITNTFMLLTS